MVGERERQRWKIELIASENYAFGAVLEAQGSWLTNKYAEGSAGQALLRRLRVRRRRRAARPGARAGAVPGAEHVNVQPHSGAQANMAAYIAVLNIGDRILGMNLAHGGHLTHGSPVNFSGKWFKVHAYGVREDDERIDYDALARQAREERPKMIVAGASAYPRIIDFERLGQIAARRRRAAHGRHGAHRRARRGRAASEPVPARRSRHDHDAQDAARPARRPGLLASGARQAGRQDRLPGHAGRAADARHRGQGGGAQAGRHRRVPQRHRADRRQRAAARRRPSRDNGAKVVSPAARTTT